LHRPVHSLAGHVLHRRAKSDAGRVKLESNRARKLNPGLRVGWAREFDFTLLSFRNLSKIEWPIIQQVGVAHPVLFIVVSFGQQPELVPAVVEPFAVRWREVLAGKLRIDEDTDVRRRSPASIARRSAAQKSTAPRDLIPAVPASPCNRWIRRGNFPSPVASVDPGSDDLGSERRPALARPTQGAISRPQIGNRPPAATAFS